MSGDDDVSESASRGAPVQRTESAVALVRAASMAVPKWLFGRYVVGDLLGQGCYGKVKEAIDARSGARVAVKIVPRTTLRRIRGGAAAVRREITLLRVLRRAPHSLHYLGVRHDRAKDKTYVLTRLCAGESLAALVARRGPLPRAQARHYARQLGCALAAVHARGVAHRDVKPDNLLISPVDESAFAAASERAAQRRRKKRKHKHGRHKKKARGGGAGAGGHDDDSSELVADALAALEEYSAPGSRPASIELMASDSAADDYTATGSAAFQPPEQMLARPSRTPALAYAGDMWAAGLTLYFALTAEHPFEQCAPSVMFERIAAAEIDYTKLPDDVCKRTLSRLLHPKPARRATARWMAAHALDGDVLDASSDDGPPADSSTPRDTNLPSETPRTSAAGAVAAGEVPEDSVSENGEDRHISQLHPTARETDTEKSDDDESFFEVERVPSWYDADDVSKFRATYDERHAAPAKGSSTGKSHHGKSGRSKHKRGSSEHGSSRKSDSEKSAAGSKASAGKAALEAAPVLLEVVEPHWGKKSNSDEVKVAPPAAAASPSSRKSKHKRDCVIQ